MHRLVHNYSFSKVSWNFKICGSSHVTISWKRSTLYEKLLFEKCQFPTELVTYLYTSNDEITCESLKNSLVALKMLGLVAVLKTEQDPLSFTKCHSLWKTYCLGEFFDA